MTITHKPININHDNPDFEFSGDVKNGSLSSNRKIATQILSTVLNGYKGNTAFRLWEGRQVVGGPDAACCIVIHDPGVLRELILYRSLSRLTEAYLDGVVTIEGNMEALFDLESHFKTLDLSWATKWRLIRLALKLPVRHGKKLAAIDTSGWRAHKNSRRSIAHHYDVGNNFYRLWLDPEMVYSCAYFRDEQQSLEDAQRDKLDYLCRKLRLQPGQYLLDIGCGWGALAIHAARHYGVNVHGITLSEEQQHFAQKKVHAEGLEQQVQIELLDYRELPDQTKYDRVVSVGMFEHVGIKNFPTYFGTVKRVLKQGGLFLNHGITSETGWRKTPVTQFINRYIFPDGELARTSDISGAMEKAGFEIIDIEGLRRHYAYTLRHWIRALEMKCDEAIQLTSEITYRLWQLYMSGSAYYFDEGSIGVYQILVSHQHDHLSIPLRRDDLYMQS